MSIRNKRCTAKRLCSPCWPVFKEHPPHGVVRRELSSQLLSVSGCQQHKFTPYTQVILLILLWGNYKKIATKFFFLVLIIFFFSSGCTVSMINFAVTFYFLSVSLYTNRMKIKCMSITSAWYPYHFFFFYMFCVYIGILCFFYSFISFNCFLFQKLTADWKIVLYNCSRQYPYLPSFLFLFYCFSNAFFFFHSHFTWSA